MSSHFKTLFFILMIGFFAVSCGQKEEGVSEESIGITVPLVTQQTTNSNGQPVTVFQANGFSSSYSNSPIPFDQIKSIKLILSDPKDGSQKELAHATLIQKFGQQPAPIQGSFSIAPNDVIFLADTNNSSLLPASIAFLQNPQIYVTIDLGNSDVFKNLYYTQYQYMTPQPTDVKLFLSFGK